jgi:hypothetical protein
MIKRFTDEQVTEALRALEAGISVGEVCHRAGVSERTLYQWRRARAPRIEAKAGPPPPAMATRLAAAELQLEALRHALQAVADDRTLEQAARSIQLRYRMSARRARRLVGLAEAVPAAAPAEARAAS